jgi:hypothetical protein
LDGNAFVANRANYFGQAVPSRAGAVMIAGDISRCVDRNGNGKIDTFIGSGTVPAAFTWPAGQAQSPDECILWHTSLTKDRNGNVVGGAGTLPRSANLDGIPAADGRLSSFAYVGLYGTNELVRLDTRDGKIVKQFDIGGPAYSAAIDKAGVVWIRDANGALRKIDPANNDTVTTIAGPACGSYAMTIDPKGLIYFAGAACLSRIDPANLAGGWESVTVPGACFLRGPTADAIGNMWVPDTCNGGNQIDISKPTGQGMTVIKTGVKPPLQSGGADYHLGSGIDPQGFPWFINTNTGNLSITNGPLGVIYRVDPTTYTITQLNVGRTPYVYSDLSGAQLALSGPSSGSLRKTFTSYCGNAATWTTLGWTATEPAGTSMTIRYRFGANATELANASFITLGTEPPALAQPQVLAAPPGANTALMQAEYVLLAGSSNTKPVLKTVTAAYTCP